MGDRTWTGIVFSGKVTRAVAEGLIEELAAQGCSCDAAGGVSGHDPVADYQPEHLLNHNQFYDDECNYASMDGVESFCRNNGISYLKTWNAGDGYTGGYELYSAAVDQKFEVEGYDEPTLNLSTMHEMAAKGTTLQEALTFLEQFTYSKFEANYPALEIID